jgi:hypothetical protein
MGALSKAPPDGKNAIRGVFAAAERTFSNLLHPKIDLAPKRPMI